MSFEALPAGAKQQTALAAGKVRAWDLPTRAFKWMLVLLIVCAWATNKFAPGLREWHKWNGYSVLVLVVFRILWGFLGGSTARFSSFLLPPQRISAYARKLFSGHGELYLGHNPLGGLMIALLLGAVAFQAATGLFSADSDRLIIDGPLAFRLTSSGVDQAARLHRFGFNLILGLSVLHIAANLFYEFVKKEGLILAMLSGRKPAATYADSREAKFGSLLLALICLALAAAVVFGSIVSLGGRL